MKKYLSTTVFLTLLDLSWAQAEIMATDRYIYLGMQAGLSEPIVKSFTHKNSGTRIKLKQSHLYGGRLGYSFYPGMMIEFAGTYQPKYRLDYKLPAQNTLIGSIPITPGTTRVSANFFMVNFIYEMQKMSLLEMKPYAIFGAGLARVSVKPTISSWNLPAQAAFILGQNSVPIFKIRKTNTNCFVWQAGGGVARDVTPNFAIDFGAKMQVINNIKINYSQLTDTVKQTFENQSPIKKTVGIGEFTIGLTYKFK